MLKAPTQDTKLPSTLRPHYNTFVCDKLGYNRDEAWNPLLYFLCIKPSL